MRRIASFTAAVLCLAAPAAFAAPQAPHDFASGIQCADCHTPYGGFNDPVKANGTASDSTSTVTTLVDGSKTWSVNEWAGGVITFTTGANAGQFRTIVSNTATVVTWSGDLAAAPAAGDEYKISKAGQAEVETKCTSCHNPSGMASNLAVVSQHQTDKGALGCGKCHDPHNTVPNTGRGNGLIREKLTYNGETAVVYPSGGANPFITDSGTPGLCQACHTKTAYFKADRTGDDTHNAATSCVGACHSHEGGFGTAAFGVGHLDPDGLAFTYGSATGSSCSRCHTASGAAAWQTAFVGNGQTAIPANPAAGAMGPLTCATCHNTNADALTKIPFQSAGVIVAAPDQQTALCGQCHQGRTSTPAVNGTLGYNYNGTVASATATSVTVATTPFTADALIGAVIQFTSGSAYGTVRTITANTTNSVSWSGNMTAAAANVTFRISGTAATAHDVDTVLPTKSFANVHYFVAAGTLFGGNFPALGGAGSQVGYEYAAIGTATTAQKYGTLNKHVASKDGCTECHSQHNGHVKIETCGSCHLTEAGAPVATVEELADSRIFGWAEADFDGDGNGEEGLKPEIDGIAAILYTAIQAYANAVSGPICYHEGANPYWFKDTDANGVCDGTYEPTTHVATGEIVRANQYGLTATGANDGKFTARLMKAAYNYQMYVKDPGAWAHNPMYMIQLLHDSIDDLNVKLTALGIPVAFNGTRTRVGHFDQDSPAFRFDTRTSTNKVTSNCAQCHGGEVGFDNYLADPMTVLTPTPVYGMECATCHTKLPNGDPDFTGIKAITSVRFPPRPGTGVPVVTGSFPVGADNLCATCHSGRETMGSIDVAIAAGTPWNIGFINPHYFPAAAMVLGADAAVGYQFSGKTYATTDQHNGSVASCVDCHNPVATKHTFDVHANQAACADCHGAGAIDDYEMASTADYDGDGVAEPIKTELAGLETLLYAAIQAYTSAAGYPVCYNSASHPYWFKDTNANGVCETSESTSANGFKFDATSLKAAFNYQLVHKDPGAWAHNFAYVAQLLIDAIEAVGGNVTGLVRP